LPAPGEGGARVLSRQRERKLHVAATCCKFEVVHCAHFFRVQVQRVVEPVTFAVEPNELADPEDVDPFSLDTVVLGANQGANAVQQLWVLS